MAEDRVLARGETIQGYDDPDRLWRVKGFMGKTRTAEFWLLEWAGQRVLTVDNEQETPPTTRVMPPNQDYLLKLLLPRSPDGTEGVCYEDYVRELEAYNEVLNHRLFIQLLDQVKVKGRLGFISEWHDPGEFCQQLVARTGEIGKRWESQAQAEARMKVVMRAVFEALDFLHGKGLVHGDIKPQNVLTSVRDDVELILLCDFGLSYKVPGDGLIRQGGGTRGYEAPELFDGLGWGPPADVWAAGVMLYWSIFDTGPFSTGEAFRQGLFDREEQMSEELADVMSRIFNPNPLVRITAHDVLLQPWFQR